MLSGAQAAPRKASPGRAWRCAVADCQSSGRQDMWSHVPAMSRTTGRCFPVLNNLASPFVGLGFRGSPEAALQCEDVPQKYPASGQQGGCCCWGAQTTFSQRGIQQRGDTRGWTETPQQKLLRLSAASAQGQLRPRRQRRPPRARAAAAAGAVDAYNAATRGSDAGGAAPAAPAGGRPPPGAGLRVQGLWPSRSCGLSAQQHRARRQPPVPGIPWLAACAAVAGWLLQASPQHPAAVRCRREAAGPPM